MWIPLWYCYKRNMFFGLPLYYNIRNIPSKAMICNKRNNGVGMLHEFRDNIIVKNEWLETLSNEA